MARKFKQANLEEVHFPCNGKIFKQVLDKAFWNKYRVGKSALFEMSHSQFSGDFSLYKHAYDEAMFYVKNSPNAEFRVGRPESSSYLRLYVDDLRGNQVEIWGYIPRNKNYFTKFYFKLPRFSW